MTAHVPTAPTSTPPTGDAAGVPAAALMAQMRATLVEQGYDPDQVQQMLAGTAAPTRQYRVREAVADALQALHRDLPRSVKTWGPYLTLLAEGTGEMCPCPCPACALGPCPCGSTPSGHAAPCTGSEDTMGDCARRWAGSGDLPLDQLTREQLNEAAWWVQRRGLKRTVRRNIACEAGQRASLRSDGRGAREAFIQATRWMFTWLGDEGRVTANPARRLTLPARQESEPRSLDAEEFSEVYRVAVSTGQDPELDGLILRHLLIQAVRRGGLLALTCGGLDVERGIVRYFDAKRGTWRTRPTTRAHMADLLTHALARGPRVPDPEGADENDRRSGVPALTASSPVFYGQPVDAFDENGIFLSRQTRPITRKRIELLFARIRRHLPWTERLELRCHDVRHTSARLVYKAADQQTAKLHLGHDGGSTTDHYLRAHFDELAAVQEALFGG